MYRLHVIASLIILALAIPGANAATITVHVVDFDFTDAGGTHFDPMIAIGDTVTWMWEEGFHSTTSVAGQTESWDSGTHPTPFQFQHTFVNAGDFVYYCLVHGTDNGDGTASGQRGIVHVSEVTPIPEPGTAGLTVLTAAGIWLVRTRRQVSQ